MAINCTLQEFDAAATAMADYRAKTGAGATFEGFQQQYPVPIKNKKEARKVFESINTLLTSGGAANFRIKDGSTDKWVRKRIELTDKAGGIAIYQADLRRAGVVLSDAEDAITKLRLATSKAVNGIRRSNVWGFGDKTAQNITKDSFVKRVETSTGLKFNEVMAYFAGNHAIERNARNTEEYNRLFNKHLLGLYDKWVNAKTKKEKDSIDRKIDKFRKTYLPPLRKGGMVNTKEDWDELERRMGTDEANRTLIAENILSDPKYAGKEQVLRDLYEEMNANTRVKMLDSQLRTGAIRSEAYNHLLNGTDATSTVQFNWYIPLQATPESLDKIDQRTSRMGKVVHSIKDVSKEGIPLEDRYDPFIASMSALHVALQNEQTNDGKEALAAGAERVGEAISGIKVEKYRAVALDTANDPFGDVFFHDFTYTGKGPDAHLQEKNSVTFFRNGELWVMKFPIPKDGGTNPMVKAFEYINRLPPSKVAEWNQGILNFMRALTTTRNPFFPPLNFFRDMAEATLNISSIKDEENLRGLRRRFFRNTPRVLAYLAVRGDKKNTGSSRLDKLHQEAEAEGMPMYFADIRGFEREAQAIDKLLKSHTVDEHLATSTGSLMNRIDKAGWKRISNALDNWSEYWEYATRFSVYVSLREMGVSAPKAARHAREVTLNFEQKGAHEQQFSRFLVGNYLFLNAGIQSIDRGLHTLKSIGVRGGVESSNPLAIGKGGAKVAFAAASFGFLMRMMQRLMGDEDDDIFQDELKKNNYFLFKIPGSETYMSIPKPYTIFRAPVTAGEYLADVMLGYEEFAPSIAVMKVLSQFLTAIDPIGMSQSLSGAIPTTLRPIGESIFNVDWAGNPVVPEFYSIDGSKPFIEKTFFGKPETWAPAEKLAQDISELIYENIASSRSVNWDALSPLALAHMIDGYFQMGFSGEVSRAIRFFSERMGDGDHTDAINYNLIPLLRRVMATEESQKSRNSVNMMEILESTPGDLLTKEQYRFILRNINETTWTPRTVKRFRTQFQDKFGKRIEELGMQRIKGLPPTRRKKLKGFSSTAKGRRLPN